MNPNVIKMEYAVRGPLVIRAGEIEKEIKQVKPKKKKKHLKEGTTNMRQLNHGNVGIFAFICFVGNRGKLRSKIDTSNLNVCNFLVFKRIKNE